MQLDMPGEVPLWISLYIEFRIQGGVLEQSAHYNYFVVYVNLNKTLYKCLLKHIVASVYHNIYVQQCVIHMQQGYNYFKIRSCKRNECNLHPMALEFLMMN